MMKIIFLFVCFCLLFIFGFSVGKLIVHSAETIDTIQKEERNFYQLCDSGETDNFEYVESLACIARKMK